MYQACADARKLLSEYRQHKDLISIGAYQRGTDPGVDRAIDMRSSLMDFLSQRMDELTPLSESQSELISRIESDAA